MSEASQAPDGARYEFTIEEADAGARLDKWLSERIEALTRTRLKALIEGGALQKDGSAFTDPSWKLRVGEALVLEAPPVAAPTPRGEHIPLDVAYEDNSVIVVNKPAGMVTHPAAGNWTGTLVNALIAHCGKSLSGIGGVARPGIVHRLDKDTSGLIVVAKNDFAHQALTAAFAERTIERAYIAVVVGAPRPGVGVVERPIGRAQDRKKFIALSDWEAEDRPDARHAVTHYKVLESYGRTRAKLAGDAVASLIECRLETGRTHQIRVHMTALGCPLVGDPVYGRGPGLPGLRPGDPAADAALEVLRSFKRQALHARSLGFSHPESGEPMRFEAAPPVDMMAIMSRLSAL